MQITYEILFKIANSTIIYLEMKTLKKIVLQNIAHGYCIKLAYQFVQHQSLKDELP